MEVLGSRCGMLISLQGCRNPAVERIAGKVRDEPRSAFLSDWDESALLTQISEEKYHSG